MESLASQDARLHVRESIDDVRRRLQGNHGGPDWGIISLRTEELRALLDVAAPMVAPRRPFAEVLLAAHCVGTRQDALDELASCCLDYLDALAEDPEGVEGNVDLRAGLLTASLGRLYATNAAFAAARETDPAL